MSATIRQYGRSTLGVWPPPVVTAIRERKDFRSGALRGEHVWAGHGASYTTGRLDPAWVDKLRHDIPSYIVSSYATPIAWWVPPTNGERARWVVPDESYSLTTTRHQRFVTLATDGGATFDVV